MSDTPFLVTPQGKPLTAGTTSDDPAGPRHVTKHLQQWFAQFAGFLQHYALALHCGICHQDIERPAKAWEHWSVCPGKSPIDVMGDGNQVVKTDAGLIVPGSPLSRVELHANTMEWFRQAQDVCGHFHLGIHCTRCKADISGLNDDTDQVYSSACSCREFIGMNRDYRAPVAPVIH